MKVAFTSCFRFKKGQHQPVWSAIKGQSPDILLFLGDCIYMDYGLSLNKPRKWKQKKFANKMYEKYRLQASVDSFRELVASVEQVGVIWDDHDFAWNNCHGAGPGKRHVPLNKRLIARGLHMQFSNWLRDDPLNKEYPKMPALNVLLAGVDKGIESYFEHENVTFVLLDGRYYREKQKTNMSSTMLGNQQRLWVEGLIQAASGPIVLCSGSVLSHGKESWSRYSDFEWLAQHQPTHGMVISGDIHENDIRTHASIGNLTEIISSGAHRPGIGGAKGNFTLLKFNGNDVTIAQYRKSGLENTKNIQL